MPQSMNAAVLFTIAAATLGCGAKTPPASTTTTRTQTSTETSSGQSSKSDVKETRTEQPDGTQEVQTTTTTKDTLPPVTTRAAAPSAPAAK